MVDLLNVVACLLTIGFGLFGFVAPRFTAAVLDLETTDSTMGLSEVRASVGGLFVIAGLAALWLNAPSAYVMLGFVYAGAALGRLVSIAFDRPPFAKAVIYGGIEALLAAWLIFANLAQ
ncbi:MAG: DUF4345 family protein [Pseudomonadota bacterium]